MNMSDVVEMVATFKIRYPNSKWHEDDRKTYQMWHEMLADLPTPLVLQVVPTLMKESRFPPDPADIRSRIFAESGLLPEPDEAWALATRYIRAKIGFWDLPVGVRLAVKQIGGTYDLRHSETPERDRERFIRAYTVIRKDEMTNPETIGMLDTLAIGAG